MTGGGPLTIDVHALPQRYPTGRQLHDAPTLWLFDDFASAAECAALRSAAQQGLAPAEVSGSTGGYLSKGRSGSNCWLPHDHSPTLLALAQRISALVGIPLSHAEKFQIVHYAPCQEYQAHFDAFEPGTERGDRCLARGGQRLITALLYLNNVEAGGATRFPKLDMDVAPQPGRLLLFHNCEAGSTNRHPASLHAGMPVIQGEKWAANLWFRLQPFI